MSGDEPRRRPHLDPGAIQSATIDTPDDTPMARAQSRFPGAAADLGALAPDAELPTLEQLAKATISGTGHVVYSSNAVFLLELDAADPHAAGQPMRAIYKPARGERPLWDFPRQTLHFRERATYLVDRALRFGLVPPTVLRDGPVGPGSVQLLVHLRENELGTAEAEALEGQLRRLAVLDVLVNNADRKRAHLLVDDNGALWGIDNALTFLRYPRQRTALLDLGGSPLEDVDAEAVRSLGADQERRGRLRAALLHLLARSEVGAFEGRLDELAEDPVYPALDPWDGRPFEWW